MTTRTPFTRRTMTALVVVVLTFGTALLAGGSPAGAVASAKKNEAKVKDASMTWAVSNYVLTPGFATLSVAEVHVAGTPATFTDGTGWTFTEGKGKFNTKTNAMTVAFPGSLEFGNTSRGNYAFKFENPTFVLDAKGAGTLTAGVSIRPAGATAFNAASKIVVVDVTATPTKTKKEVTVTASPTAFSSALITAVGTELASHFQASGSSNDPNKPPAPITVEFAYKAPKS